MFHVWTSLGSNVHVVKAEVNAVYNVSVNLMKRMDCGIAALSIDNSAKAVAEEVAKDLKRDMAMMVLALW